MRDVGMRKTYFQTVFPSYFCAILLPSSAINYVVCLPENCKSPYTYRERELDCAAMERETGLKMCLTIAVSDVSETDHKLCCFLFYLQFLVIAVLYRSIFFLHFWQVLTTFLTSSSFNALGISFLLSFYRIINFLFFGFIHLLFLIVYYDS